jgi:hypothetical protein
LKSQSRQPARFQLTRSGFCGPGRTSASAAGRELSGS